MTPAAVLYLIHICLVATIAVGIVYLVGEFIVKRFRKER